MRAPARPRPPPLSFPGCLWNIPQLTWPHFASVSQEGGVWCRTPSKSCTDPAALSSEAGRRAPTLLAHLPTLQLSTGGPSAGAQARARRGVGAHPRGAAFAPG